MIDLSGVPVALLSAIFGGVQAQVGSLLDKYLDYKYQYKLAEYDAVQTSRETKSKGFVFTRRILAIMSFGYIFIGAFIAAMMHIPIWVSYTQIHGTLSSVITGPSTTKWIQITGFVLAPVSTYIASAVAFLYFNMKR